MDTFRIVSTATPSPSVISRTLRSRTDAVEAARIMNRLGHPCLVMPEEKTVEMPVYAQGWRETEELLEFFDETETILVQDIDALLEQCKTT
jgi:IS4 transposase